MSEDIMPLIIDEKACNGCGRCVDVCMMNVLELRERSDGTKGRVAAIVRPEECMFCEACVIGCRSTAILLNPRAGSAMIKSINENMLRPKKKWFRSKK
ncbi:MAG TPA: 4Fe-4S dicluster domain-containing protein [Spirochaetota bacterium]|nr:4Fe-4S dicluster domain-containing protein [Spirochaetota bacterium]HPJ33479.1 4Fe-4S dicluster domain-containing protein [Spirochaetota bacterium]